MSLDTDLVTRLKSHAGVQGIVAGRIYPTKIPDTGTLPCVVYRRISTVPVLASGSAPLRRARYQIDCWAQRHIDADALATEMRDAMDYASAGFVAAFPDNDADDPDDDSGAHRRRLDYFIWER